MVSSYVMKTEVNTAMKLRTIRRHIAEGSKNIVRNSWMSIASIGAVTMTLALVGVFLALVLNLNEIAKNIEQDVEIKVFIDRLADEDAIEELGEKIKEIETVESIRFSSNDEELVNLSESMGEQGEAWLLYKQDNPLNHAYIVQTAEPTDTEKTADEIASFEVVDNVNFGKEVVENLFQFNKFARNVGLVVIVGLVLTAIFLISNTIKLTIMNRSKEIGIMKLVGATNGFIRWPFFIEGLLLGILGSIIPISMILFGYSSLEKLLTDQIHFRIIDLLPYNPFAWQLSLVILAIGTFIGVWGSVMSVRKFLKV